METTVSTIALNICRNSYDFLANSKKSELDKFMGLARWNWTGGVVPLRAGSANVMEGCIKVQFVIGLLDVHVV